LSSDAIAVTAVCGFLRKDSSSYAERYKQNKMFTLTTDINDAKYEALSYAFF
jgi:hypothetical protein